MTAAVFLTRVKVRKSSGVCIAIPSPILRLIQFYAPARLCQFDRTTKYPNGAEFSECETIAYAALEVSCNCQKFYLEAKPCK